MAAGDFNLGSNLDMHGNQILNGKWQVLASAPSSPVAWQIYNNSTDGKTYQRNAANSAWVDISAPTGYIKADGTVAFTGDQSMGGFKLTNVGDATLAGDAVNFDTLNKRIVRVFVEVPAGTNMSTIGNGSVVNGYTLSTGQLVFVSYNLGGEDGGLWLVGASSCTYSSAPYIVGISGGSKSGNLWVLQSDTTYARTSSEETAQTLGDRTNALTAKSTPVDADMLPLMDSAASNVWKKLSWANVKATFITYLTSLNYLTNSSTHVLTNKTFDANGAGNAVSNLETADFATNVIDTDVALTANSDTRIASQKAVKAYAAPETVATIGAVTAAASAKTSLVDADTLPLNDSAASNALKKITVANVKAWLLTVPLLGWTLGSNAAITASDTITGAFGKIQAQLNAVGANVLAQVLTGFTTGSNTVISATNTVLTAFQDIQAQITGYAASTRTFTNKSIDANGTGNSITNLETADFASGVIQTSISGSSTNSQIPTALAVHSAITSAVTGLFDDRGAFDASVNTYPSSGGSGTAGAILKGDIWTISVAGTIGGKAVVAGDSIRALIDTPGTTLANWAFGEQNQEQATTSTLGLVRLATLAEAEAKSDSAKAVVSADLANFLLGKSSAFLIGNGSATSFNLTHSFGKKIKSCKIRKVSDGSNWGDCGYDSSTSVYVVNFGAYVPSTNEFEVELAA